MSRRHKMSKHHSKKVFTRGAQRVHGRNQMTVSGPMRGGIRL